MKSMILSALVLILGGEALACPVDYEELMRSPKSRKVKQEASLGLNQGEFFETIDLVQKKYDPEFRELGLKLDIVVDWNNPSKNMFSASRGHDRIISVSGGLAKIAIMKKDSFVLTMCHEVGHHIGGLPKMSKSHWASAEGQADYFAALKCMREVLEDSQKVEASSYVEKKCQEQFVNPEICVRTSVAGKVIASLDSYLNRDGASADIDWARPDKNIVNFTLVGYPSEQCRLDTFFLGALRDEDSADIIGLRPACWFKAN